MPQGPAPIHPVVPRPLSRRTLFVGAGAAATTLALAACDGEPSGKQSAEPGGLSASLSEYGKAGGDVPVWQMTYDIDEDEDSPETYSGPAQAARHAALEDKRSAQDWTANDPLLVLDPYGTTRTGLYVHFAAADPGALEFTITADATADYHRTAANHAEDGTGFTGLLVGLVPGARNHLRLTWTPTGGEPITRELDIQPPGASSVYQTQLSIDVPDPEALSPGLFALTGVSSSGNASFLFDNEGVGRGELLSTDHPNHNIRVEDGRLVVTTGSQQVSVIDPFGHADPIIDTGDQVIHHDLEVVGDMVYVPTSKSGAECVEDRITRIDLTTGDVTEVVNLQTVFPEYEKLAHAREEGFAGGTDATGKDWIHINSVQIVDEIMYLSARETSTVFALDDALEPDSTPSVRWMIGAQEIWEGTGYEDLFLAPDGSPTGNAGQHSVARLDDDALPAGQYYVEMFNNNHWFLGTRDDEVWQDVGPEGASGDDFEGVSQILRYLVDEDAGTFREDQRVDVAYSSVVSNVQRIGGDSVENPMAVNSGKANVFAEHTADGQLVGTFRYGSSNMAYRVYKDAFDGFWFTGP
ncbi:aryl-sulfate sulfotransferase [Brachybacterium fresconis]|uniref:Arylsulfotransferase N-terminal domain-containing protein n=1 Tax=Brachybacterium fresconis TaxID=173363 RepID=A0ABS4YLU5_9MICO|nr:aryl-sulfate sulfotransferase [Brachybacterium fresconis]MBP2409764.1 hypothetical protein [Brachybacterium fresconis]